MCKYNLPLYVYVCIYGYLLSEYSNKQYTFLFQRIPKPYLPGHILTYGVGSFNHHAMPYYTDVCQKTFRSHGAVYFLMAEAPHMRCAFLHIPKPAFICRTNL